MLEEVPQKGEHLPKSLATCKRLDKAQTVGGSAQLPAARAMKRQSASENAGASSNSWGQAPGRASAAHHARSAAGSSGPDGRLRANRCRACRSQAATSAQGSTSSQQSCRAQEWGMGQETRVRGRREGIRHRSRAGTVPHNLVLKSHRCRWPLAPPWGVAPVTHPFVFGPCYPPHPHLNPGPQQPAGVWVVLGNADRRQRHGGGNLPQQVHQPAGGW